MKYIIQIVFELFKMAIAYISAILIILFDGMLFGGFVMLINNIILVKLYSLPEITYYDGVGILFLIKVIALMIKSITVDNDNNNEIDPLN